MIIITVILEIDAMMFLIKNWKYWVWKKYFSDEPDPVTRVLRDYIEDREIQTK